MGDDRKRELRVNTPALLLQESLVLDLLDSEDPEFLAKSPETMFWVVNYPSGLTFLEVAARMTACTPQASRH